VLIADPTRFDGVQVLGVDEHAWRHTRRGDKFVTVIIDLTPVRDGTGPSRLLDMAGGRSKQVFKTWLEAQTSAFRDGIEIVAMDGFTGFKTAAAEEIPDAVAVMDPFHVVALASDALDRCRQRVNPTEPDYTLFCNEPFNRKPRKPACRGLTHPDQLTSPLLSADGNRSQALLCITGAEPLGLSSVAGRRISTSGETNRCRLGRFASRSAYMHGTDPPVGQSLDRHHCNFSGNRMISE